MTAALRIIGSGMCCAVGTSAPAARAAIRARLSRFTQSRFVDEEGEPLMVASLPLGDLIGARRLTAMLDRAVRECLEQQPDAKADNTGLWLLLSDRARPGFNRKWEKATTQCCHDALGAEPKSQQVISSGRTSVAAALTEARSALESGRLRYALIAAVDSYLNAHTVNHMLSKERLQSSDAKDGFIPGEGAGAILLSAEPAAEGLLVLGVGSADDPAHIGNDHPVRAEGLSAAIRAALKESPYALSDLDFRMADIAGESFFFREAGLALSRVFDKPRDSFPLLHITDSVGETGAAVGPLSLAYLAAAMPRGITPGARALFHLQGDDGARAAIVIESRHSGEALVTAGAGS